MIHRRTIDYSKAINDREVKNAFRCFFLTLFFCYSRLLRFYQFLLESLETKSLGYELREFWLQQGNGDLLMMEGLDPKLVIQVRNGDCSLNSNEQ